jgi:hypothetical protein
MFHSVSGMSWQINLTGITLFTTQTQFLVFQCCVPYRLSVGGIVFQRMRGAW